ncbi:MAG: hypothetical protein ACRDT4_00555 [Micromonosporaceae bacterium]
MGMLLIRIGAGIAALNLLLDTAAAGWAVWASQFDATPEAIWIGYPLVRDALGITLLAVTLAWSRGGARTRQRLGWAMFCYVPLALLSALGTGFLFFLMELKEWRVGPPPGWVEAALTASLGSNLVLAALAVSVLVALPEPPAPRRRAAAPGVR